MHHDDAIISAYSSIRNITVELCGPLAVEDYVIQSIPDTSPPKWHLGHTTWFFESFIFKKNRDYREFDPLFAYLFNSYYNGAGPQFPRAQRGLLARPTVEAVMEYRRHVDRAMLSHLPAATAEERALVELGLHHEQQHQELLLMDLKHNLSVDPACPAYLSCQTGVNKPTEPVELQFIEMGGGLVELGHSGSGFCYDNELPQHRFFLRPYAIANRLVTNGEYLEFVEAGGYQMPDHWLSDAWDMVRAAGWQAPLYWRRKAHEWFEFTLAGLSALKLDQPVTHISYYEAAAYASWRGLRLPTEQEWEHFVLEAGITAEGGNFLENGYLHPQACQPGQTQAFGDAWEWTSSDYRPYPGFRPLPGALGEYNGKFMNNQRVMRGGSCLTPASHIRPSYRNFFGPDKRWQSSAIRLAHD